jgi:hypothetical protein
LKNSFRISQQRNNFQQQFPIYDVETGEVLDTRVFTATYRTDIDWTPDFSLPPFARNRFNLTPSLSLQNVDPGPFSVKSERSGGRFVTQSKRFTAGLSASPTIFGLFRGFGPFQRIRHQISPTIGYTFAPEGQCEQRVSHRTRQNAKGVSRQPDAERDHGRSSAEFRGEAQDERQRHVGHRRGKGRAAADAEHDTDLVRFRPGELADGAFEVGRLYDRDVGLLDQLGIAPGFDFTSSYSLFQGSPLSDTAKFKPYLTSIAASFSISRSQNPFGALLRLFGLGSSQEPASAMAGSGPISSNPVDVEARARAALAAQSAAGNPQAGGRFMVPPTDGWRAMFNFNRSSPRPPIGTNVIEYDTRARCEQNFGAGTLLFDACVNQQRLQPTTDTPVTSQTAGGTGVPHSGQHIVELQYQLQSHEQVDGGVANQLRLRAS